LLLLVFEILQSVPTETQQTYTCIGVFHDIIILGQWKLKGRGNQCDKERKILHGASVN
jgi:hypothetical protein